MSKLTFDDKGRNRVMATRRALLVGAAIAAAGVSLLTVPPARAEEVIDATFIAGFPPAATFVGSFTDGYMQAVDAALAREGRYKINWNLAHSGQIAKPRGEFEALQGGLGDIAVVPSPYYFDRVPMFEIPFVTPFTTDDPVHLSAVYKKMEDRFPSFREIWSKYNQKLLVTTANADAYVLISKDRIGNLDDMKGMKIAGVGPNLRWLSAIEAVPVQGSMADWYTGLNTGLYEGAMATPQSLGAFKLCEPAKFLLEPGLGANGNVNLNVNLNWWNGLPEEVQAAFVEAAPVYNQRQLELLQVGSKNAVANCTSKSGMTTTELPEEERLKWANSMPNLAQEWAERMEEMGYPGKEMLTFYMDEMRAANQPIARHWDRE